VPLAQHVRLRGVGSGVGGGVGLQEVEQQLPGRLRLGAQRADLAHRAISLGALGGGALTVIVVRRSLLARQREQPRDALPLVGDGRREPAVVAQPRLEQVGLLGRGDAHARGVEPAVAVVAVEHEGGGLVRIVRAAAEAAGHLALVVRLRVVVDSLLGLWM
jgi:hypothetical protein